MPNNEAILKVQDPSIYQISHASYSGLADNAARRRAIVEILQDMTFGISTSRLDKNQIEATGGFATQIESYVQNKGVCWVTCHNDGSGDTWSIQHGHPVVFDTVSAKAVTGINPNWETSEYHIVGIALKSFSGTGFDRIPVSLTLQPIQIDNIAYGRVVASGVAGIQGLTPGVGSVELYKFEGPSFTDLAPTGEIVPVVNAGRDLGFQEIVKVAKDSFGNWTVIQDSKAAPAWIGGSAITARVGDPPSTVTPGSGLVDLYYRNPINGKMEQLEDINGTPLTITVLNPFKNDSQTDVMTWVAQDQHGVWWLVTEDCLEVP